MCESKDDNPIRAERMKIKREKTREKKTKNRK